MFTYVARIHGALTYCVPGTVLDARNNNTIMSETAPWPLCSLLLYRNESRVRS